MQASPVVNRLWHQAPSNESLFIEVLGCCRHFLDSHLASRVRFILEAAQIRICNEPLASQLVGSGL